jgi:O-antigen/teichoic acid export membrane protein
VNSTDIDREAVAVADLAIEAGSEPCRIVTPRMAWALLDQAFFSFGNFAVGVLLARWLPAEEYGAFVVAYSVFLLVATVHTAAIADPMVVFGPGRFAGKVGDYFRALLATHAGLVIATSIVLCLAGVVSSHIWAGSLGATLIALSAAVPCILSSWLVRRAFYVDGNLHLAALGGFVYLAIAILAMGALHAVGWLSPTSALLIMGLASALVAFWLGRRHWKLSEHDALITPRVVARTHFEYARWGLLASALGWVPSSIFFLVLPMWHGVAASAALRALTNFTQPALQASNALATSLVPLFVRERQRGHFRALIWRASAVFALGAAAYWLVLACWGAPLMQVLYRGQYAAVQQWIPMLGALPVVAAVGAVLTAALQSLERPDRIMIAWSAAAILSSTIGVGLAYVWDIPGAVAGMIVGFGAAALTMIWSFPRVAPPPRIRIDEDVEALLRDDCLLAERPELLP